MNDQTWHDGPPPSMGWWPCWTVINRQDGYRWWDGWQWSVVLFERDTMDTVESLAATPTAVDGIQWKHRPASWPERSRT